MNIGILGSGKWARALATLTAEAGHQPRIGYTKKRALGFPGTPNIPALCRESDLILIATSPSQVRTLVTKAKLQPSNHVIVASQGLDPHKGGWLSDIISEESSAVRVGVLTGPALTSEILQRRPSAMVVASRFEHITRITQKALHSSICRIYTSSDIIGVELAGAMVTIITIALGLADSLNQGIGVRGIIVARGLAEASRLGLAIGAEEHSFLGLAGVGDVIACGSHSENPKYDLGRQLGIGKSIPDSITKELEAILDFAKLHNVEMPLTEAVVAIALGKLKVRLAIDMLMRREATEE
jgi:glycerol-3-phosphate dehydrogenase (NAD(P)+)